MKTRDFALDVPNKATGIISIGIVYYSRDPSNGKTDYIRDTEKATAIWVKTSADWKAKQTKDLPGSSPDRDSEARQGVVSRKGRRLRHAV